MLCDYSVAEAAPDNDRDIVMVDTAKQTTPLVEFVRPKTTGTTRAPYVVGGDDMTPKQGQIAATSLDTRDVMCALRNHSLKRLCVSSTSIPA